uniref:[RNA-polymerase]-subunit kinase n=1 Tax=Leersia perrieri TaxID=77586 RepID=A0A0D9XHW6_9ORYZ
MPAPATGEATALNRKRAAADAPDPRACGSSPASGAKRRRYNLGSADDYEKLEVVGQGAFGVVMKARDRRTGKMVALKRLIGVDEGARFAPDFDALRVEVACQHACRGHPSIVEIKDVVGDGKTGEIFLVMEFVGNSLREELPRARPEDLVRVMMRQLVGAANKMHASRVIHRDIKPENILVSFFGELKICDFGAATLMKLPGKPYDLPRPGTLPYTSPEQLAGNRCYGPAVDMWALGCIMGELLTGAPLFGGDMTAEELHDDLSKNLGNMIDELRFEVLPELSPAAGEVLSGLLAFDPEKRMTAAEALNHRWFTEKAKKAEYPGFGTAAAAMASKRPAPDGDATASPQPLTSIYDYESIDIVGRGAYGVVRLARHRHTGDTVAIKCFYDKPGCFDEDGYGQQDAVAFNRELDCLAACQGHPSVVQLRDVAVEPASHDMFLVMEFVGRHTLRDLIFCRRFSDAETRVLMRQLLTGAKAIHGAGLIHRDVKPGNVLVGTGCTLKFCDFGAATPAASTPFEEVVVGTLRYTSPEQLAGNRCYGQAVDMWALGCVMIELLTGRFVFTSSDTVDEHVLDLFDLEDCNIGSRDSPAFGGLPGLSPAGREVLAGLLDFDHKKRMTAEAALEHRWFTEEADCPARPAPDGDAPILQPCYKKPRRQFTSIFNYEIPTETLGAGTYGVVYKTRDRHTGETVAVKWVRPRRGLVHGLPANLAAFARERDCLAKCRGNPSVVQIKDVAANPRNWDMFLVMEFVGRWSLRDFIGASPFSEAETRALMRQLLAGVSAMHGAGMAHRDIKPGNILVGAGCALKICDLGMATTAAPPYEEFRVGTMWYNSPEQLTGRGQYDAKAADMWALGCVMAELLTGGPVFTSETAEEHLDELTDLRNYEIACQDSLAFRGLPGLSPAGCEVLAGLLAFDGDKRMTAEAALEHRWFTEEADSPAVLECLAKLVS